jgi:N-methylhydantoinase B
VSPLFYLHRRLARDTAGPGKFRGGLSAEVALTLGGIERAEALIMTHGAEMPNTQGLSGGWPGATIKQRMGRNAVKDGLPQAGEWQEFGPKPGLTPMSNRDIFAVTWQGGGGYGDPLERDAASVERDVAAAWVSPEAARRIYGVVIDNGRVDAEATRTLRQQMRQQRVRKLSTDPARLTRGETLCALGDTLMVVRDERGVHVVTKAGYVLCTGSTRWRQGAESQTVDALPPEHKIDLHERLAVTTWYCPASGTQLAVDVHEKGVTPLDDVVLDSAWLEGLRKTEDRQRGETTATPA